ncbi:MAG: hypothetical protein OWU33_16155 [Firmicutes bacterium]|nr:hypothetical protein [Bacillota bacterium]
MTNAERDAWALFRYRLISPLLDPAVSAADRAAYWAFLRDHPPTTPDGQVWVPSSRSIQRYCAAYRAGGLDALRPQRRRDHGTRRAFSDPLWVQAVALKREVPERSADQVYLVKRKSPVWSKKIPQGVGNFLFDEKGPQGRGLRGLWHHKGGHHRGASP